SDKSTRFSAEPNLRSALNRPSGDQPNLNHPQRVELSTSSNPLSSQVVLNPDSDKAFNAPLRFPCMLGEPPYRTTDNHDLTLMQAYFRRDRGKGATSNQRELQHP
ncbi:hypothetical protein TorRG33x02_222690, partial [Trema orientale]